MMTDLRGLFWIFVLAIPCFGQNAHSTQSTTGNCSPILTGNQITVTCINQKALVEIQAILTKIVQNQLPPDQVMQKLDDILATVKGASLGNLRERANDFSKEIRNFLQETDLTDPSKNPTLAKSASPDALRDMHRRWDDSAENEFALVYWDKVVKLRDEFAAHSYRDKELDEIIENTEQTKRMSDQHEKSLQSNPQLRQTFPSIKWSPIWPEIVSIAESFSSLASQLPQAR